MTRYQIAGSVRCFCFFFFFLSELAERFSGKLADRVCPPSTAILFSFPSTLSRREIVGFIITESRKFNPHLIASPSLDNEVVRDREQPAFRTRKMTKISSPGMRNKNGRSTIGSGTSILSHISFLSPSLSLFLRKENARRQLEIAISVD